MKLFVSLLLTVSAVIARADQTVYVNQAAPPSSTQSGSSWANAFRDLQPAIAAAKASSQRPIQIWVAKGIYKPTTDSNRNAFFSLTSSMALRGGFAGTETDPSQRPFVGYPTILSGDIGMPQRPGNEVTVTNLAAGVESVVFDQTDSGFADNSANVIVLRGVTNVILDSLVITGGNANNTNNGVKVYETAKIQSMVIPADLGTIEPLNSIVAGGGLYLEMPISSTSTVIRPASESTVSLVNCSFINNRAEGFGAGICARGGNLNLQDCHFQGNVAREDGGAFFGGNQFSTMQRCDFLNNHSGSGGAIGYGSIPTKETLNPKGSANVLKLVQSTIPLAVFVGKVVLNATADDAGERSVGAVLSETALSESVLGNELSSFGSLYNGVSLGISAVNFGVQLSVLLGVSPNDPFIVGWNSFNNNFSTYATPVGWMFLFFDSLGISKDDAPPSLQEQMDTVKRSWLTAFNVAPYSKIFDSTFRGNSAASFGGAIAISYDNVLISRCVFRDNSAQGSGGAIACASWNTPRIMNTAFYNNSSLNGHSVIYNYAHTRTEMVNCTFVENSTPNKGFAIGNDLGADVKVFNCAMWGNKNVEGRFANGGADIFTTTSSTLDANTRNKNAGSPAILDYTAICDIRYSDIQGLFSMPVGVDNFDLYHPDPAPGIFTSLISLFSGSKSLSDDEKRDIASSYYHWDEFFAALPEAVDFNADIYHTFVNLGEGNRPHGFIYLQYSLEGNRSENPALVGLVPIVPLSTSPIIGRGSSYTSYWLKKFLGDPDQRDMFGTYPANNPDLGAVQYSAKALAGTVIFVKPTPTGDGSGRDWNNARGDLIGLLNDANLPSGVSVWVAEGTYSPAGSAWRTFRIKNGLTLYGGFAGTENSLSERHWQAHPTILNGNNSVENVVTMEDVGPIDGFTITGGNASGYGNGGGIFGQTPSQTIVRNCNFVNNHAAREGGGAWFDKALIENCSFTSNSANNSGTRTSGGGLAINSDATVLNCVFNNNSGGGLASYQNLRLYSSTFYGNTAPFTSQAAGGAGLFASWGTGTGGEVTVANCIFWSNSVPGGLSTEWNQLAFAPWYTGSDTHGFSVNNCVIQGLALYSDIYAQGNSPARNGKPVLPATVALQTTCSSAEPSFVSAASGNFQLAVDSSAIGLGTASGVTVPATDRDGNPRLVGGRMDAGAYEFQGAVSLVPTTIASDCSSAGTSYTLAPVLGGFTPPASYLWQVDRHNGLGYVAVSNDGFTSGATTATLTLTSPSAIMNGWTYRLAPSSGLQFRPVSLAIPNPIYVNAANQSVYGQDGTSWATAFSNFGQIKDIPNQSCQQIWVAAGTYYTQETQLRSHIGIYGGFAGNETSLSQRNWTNNVTIITGYGTLILGDGDINTVVDGSAILDGFTIVPQNIAGTLPMRLRSSNGATIRNCTFTGSSGYRGPAMINEGNASPHVVNCIFRDFQSSDGTVLDANAHPTFENCLFFNNQCATRGAAIHMTSSLDTVINCTFSGNYAAQGAGAIYNDSGTCTIRNSILWNNNNSSEASGQLDQGGTGVSSVYNSIVQGRSDTSNGNLPYDPLFQNAVAGDFSLSSASPAINVGDNAFTNSATDVAGAPRVFGSNIDIGAYEFQLPTSPTVALGAVPHSLSSCANDGSVSFFVSGAISNSYQWEVNSGNGFAPATNAIYSVTGGGGSSTLSVTTLSTNLDGNQFRFVLNGGYTSAPLILNVSPVSRVYVNASATGLNNGTSWANAFTTVMPAIQATPGSCSEIWVAGGTYSTQGVEIRTGARMYGGFAGTENSLSERDPTNHPTYLNAYVTKCPVLDGFVMGGRVIVPSLTSSTIANCVFSNIYGCGIKVSFASATVSNCLFYSGSLGYTNAISLEGSTASISDCLFSGGSGVEASSALSSTVGSLATVDRCSFTGNSGKDGAALFTGAGSRVSIANSLFANNTAGTNGGAIFHGGDDLTVVNCTFSRNFARQGGGAIYSEGNKLTVLNSILWNNSVSAGSPGIGSVQAQQLAWSRGVTTVSNSVVQGLSGFSGNGNIAFDPLFKNPEFGDFTLSASSPALNLGNNGVVNGVGLDLAKALRTFGGTVDLGAYELQSAANTPLNLLASATSQEACYGRTAFFVVSLGTNASTPVIQWQAHVGSNFVTVINDGTNGVINTVNSSALAISNVTAATIADQYRWIVSGQYTSPAVTLTVGTPRLIYVNAAAVGLRNGTTWANAFTNLQQALADTGNCSAQIWIAQGEYRVNPSSLGDNFFAMRSGVEIYGGFVGTETILAQRDWQQHVTVLVGNGNGAVVKSEGYYYNVNQTALLDGCTIRNPGAGSDLYGMQNFQASPTVRNCVFDGCGSGGIWNGQGSQPIVSNCSFINNHDSGLVNRDGSSVTASNCVFVGNQAQSRGGGIFNMDSIATVYQCTFTNNNGLGSGGAIVNERGVLNVSLCSFQGNTSGDGGAINSLQGSLTISRAVFRNNSSGHTGGAVAAYKGTNQISYCTFVDNTAQSSGAGLYQQDGNMTVQHSIFWKNTNSISSASIETRQATIEQMEIVAGGGAIGHLVTNAIVNSLIQGLQSYVGIGNIAFEPTFVYPPPLYVLAGTPYSPPTAGIDSTSGGYQLFIPVVPLSVNACSGSTAQFTISGLTNYTFNWQVDTGSGFTNVGTGGLYATTTEVTDNLRDSTLSIFPVDSSMNTWHVRCQETTSGLSFPAVDLRTSAPHIVYVNGTNILGANNGSSWANAFTNLQDAITSSDCAEIWVAKGTYVPTPFDLGAGNGQTLTSFMIKSGLALYGGFNGTETNRNQRDWQGNPTFLQGAGGNALFSIEGTHQVIDRSAVLDGFRMTGMQSPLRSIDASPVIRNCTFVQSAGVSIYSWIHNGARGPLVDNCVFSNNLNSAIYNVGGPLQITASTFVNNTGQGSAIFNNAGPLLVSSSSFINNQGGAIYSLADAGATIDSSIFIGNTGTSFGAIHNEKTYATISRCSFASNSVSGQGGAVSFDRDSGGIIANCLFRNNSAGLVGGAIANDSETPAGLKVVNCTIVDNTVENGSGGGIYVGAGRGGSGFNFVLRNSVVWGNRSLNGAGSGVTLGKANFDSLVTFSTACDIQGLNGVEPLFAGTGDYHLTAVSPLLRAGTADGDAGVLDLDGNARTVGGLIDMGCYEFEPAGTPASDRPRFTTLPKSINICDGSDASFVVQAENLAGYSYIWQQWNGSTYVNLADDSAHAIFVNAQGSTLIVRNVSVGTQTLQLVVSNGTGPIYTAPFSIVVNSRMIVYVNATNSISGNGSSWTTAYTNLQTAVEERGSCNEFWVAAGTYPLSALQLQPSLSIYGGFAGNETSRSQRDWINRISVLTEVPGQMLISGDANSVVLDGLTITGCNENRNIELSSPNVAFLNCTLVRNNTGGNLVDLTDRGVASFVNCAFRNNTASRILNVSGSASTTNTHQAFASLTNCVFANNKADAQITTFGGGYITLAGCGFYTNSGGNVIYASRPTWFVPNPGSCLATRCAFVGNSCDRMGGVLFNRSANVFSMDNCLLASNTASQGGAIANIEQAKITLKSCDVVYNHASVGGGIYDNSPSGQQNYNAYNCVFWGNTDTGGYSGASVKTAQIFGAQQLIGVTGCVQGSTGADNGGNVNGVNPLFANESAGNFRLSPNSPYLNAGDGNGVGAAILDLDGNTRVAQGAVDVGCYEFQGTAGTRLEFAQLPQSQTICEGQTATFTVTGFNAQYEVGPQIQWSYDSGSGFIPVTSNATQWVVVTNAPNSTVGPSSTLVVSNAPGNYNGIRYMASVSGYSNIVTLGVVPRGVIYVKATATGGNNGLSWSDAFTNLNSALQIGSACSEVWVAQGTYSSSVPAAFSIPAGLQVYGGFSGNETNRLARNATAYPTLLKYNGQSDIVQFVSAPAMPAIDATTILDSFVLAGASSTRSAISNYLASPTIRNCVFTNNSGVAVVNNVRSSPSVENCRFVKNLGNVINNNQSRPVVVDCLFATNYVTVIQNDSSSSAVINRSVFIGNDMPNGSPISNFGSLRVLGSSFISNRGDNGAIMNLSTSSIVNCVFSNNLAKVSYGGAIFNSYGVMGVTNCLLIWNSAQVGGAIANSAALAMVNCTISDNSAQIDASGLFNYGGSAVVINSILWGNRTNNLSSGLLRNQYYESSGTVTISSCCLQGYFVAGDHTIGFDPLFQNPAAGNYRLQPFSPSVGRGDIYSIVGVSGNSGVTIDLDGNPRTFNGRVDLGAYQTAADPVANPTEAFYGPVSQTVCDLQTASFTAARGTASGTIDWFYSTDGTNWNPIAYGTSSVNGVTHIISGVVGPRTVYTLSIPNAPLSLNGIQYKAQVSGAVPVDYVASLTVNPIAPTYVNAAAPPGGNGQSWATAYNDLTVPLGQATLCSRVIWVAEGTYTNAHYFGLPVGVQVYGGFGGSETNLSQRNPALHPTILKCVATAPEFVVVFTSSGSTAVAGRAVLDGVVVENGLASGIFIQSVDGLVQNCVVRSNHFGIQINDASPTIRNCSIVNNRWPQGGGIRIYQSSALTAPLIENCSIRGNTNSSTGGGGVSISGAQPTLVNCVITGNRSSAGGGLAANNNASPTLINCTISGNYAEYYGGGGMEVDQSTLLMTNCIVWGNSALGAGYQGYYSGIWANGYAGNEKEGAQIFKFSSTIRSGSSCIEGLSLFTGIGNVAYDPLFISPISGLSAPATNGDFHLGSCSPLAELGTNSAISGFVADLDALARVVNVVDLGAYELQSVVTTPLYVASAPASFTYCSLGLNAFQVVANSGDVGYQWETDRNDGNSFVPLNDSAIFSGTASSTLVISNATFALNSNLFRCTINSTNGCTVSSSAAVLTVRPGRFYVNASAPANGDGLSWATAFTNLTPALNHPQRDPCGTELWVAAGTYLVPTSATFFLGNDIAIYGGFNGTETNRSERNWATNLSILSGYRVGGNASIVMNVLSLATDPATRLDGLIFENAGTAVQVNGEFNGTVANCTFRFLGNGVVTSVQANSNPWFTHCFFDQNTGIAISCRGNSGGGSHPRISDCVFTRNQTSPIWCLQNIPTIERCEFRGNRSSLSAGGSIGAGATGTAGVDLNSCDNGLIVDCLFSGNLGNGAVLFNNSYTEIRNSTFTGNYAQSSGAGLYVGSSFGVKIYNCIFWNNFNGGNLISYQGADRQAGQVYSDGSVSSVANNCITFDAPANAFPPATGNVDYNPVFVQPIDATSAPTVAGDFHLAPCSPVIGIGGNSFVTETNDLSNAPRLVNTVDMGAYEFQGSPAASLTITTQPVDFSYCISGPNVFQVAASGTGLTYQWQANLNDGNGFVTLSNDATYSSTTSSQMTVTNPAFGLNGSLYRCAVSSSAGCVVYSKTVKLTVAFARWYVNVSAPVDGDGQSWASPKKSLVQLLQNPALGSCGTEIWVAAGTNVGNFNVPNGVAVYGGFNGTETNLAQRNWTTNQTIAILSSGTVVFNLSGAHNSYTRLDGLIIQNATFGVSADTGANLTVANCSFQQARVYSQSSSPTVQNCSFTGLGIYCDLSNLRVEDCRFTGNTLAAVSNSRSSVTIDRCTFRGNLATCVQHSGSASTWVLNSLFSGNSGSPSAISLSSGQAVTASYCTFAGNKSGSGGVIFSSGSLEVFNSIFWNSWSTANNRYVYGGVAASSSPIFHNGPLLHLNSNWYQNQPSDSPLFAAPVDATNAPTVLGNYQLNSASPVIDSGDFNLFPGETNDLARATRVFGIAVDQGAYEYQGRRVFPATELPEALDATNFNWTIGGVSSWFLQTNMTHDGVDAAQSGAVSQGEETWMQTSIVGPGTVSFWSKVSSVTNQDFLEYYIDGALQGGSISGDVDWQQNNLSATPGSHVVRWRFVKGSNTASDVSSAWVDQVSFVPDATSTLIVTTNADSGPGSLRQALLDASLNGNGTIAIIQVTNVTGVIALSNSLPILTNPVVIVGPGATNLTIDGGGTNRILFVDALGYAVQLRGLTLAHGMAKGGNGSWRAGGGAGMGGAIFVNAGNVTVSNVSFVANAAIGGAGGTGVGLHAAGGGGGLGGNGGDGFGNASGAGGGGGFAGDGGIGQDVAGGGGGGRFGHGGAGKDSYGGGGGGLVDGGDSTNSTPGLGFGGGGKGSSGGGSQGVAAVAGLLYGGGGGGGYTSSVEIRAHGAAGGKFGGGGGGGANGAGGVGGDFGGGGGTGASSFAPGAGDGGFGGGGGGGGNSLNAAGYGGFGGGGGGGVHSDRRGLGGAFGGNGGYYDSSNGSIGGGGGGAALGAAVFVRPNNGASFTFIDSDADAGSTTAGNGADGSTTAFATLRGTPGQTAGSALFLSGGTNTFTVQAQSTNLIVGSIGAWSGSPASLLKTGAGTLILGTTNTYTGVTIVDTGSLTINGSISASSLLTVNNGATIGGNGTLPATILNPASTVSPGNEVGALTSGNVVWNDSGNYNWQMYDASGSAGTGYDLLTINGTLTLSAITNFSINLWSLASTSPAFSGDCVNFSNAVSGSWTLIQTTGGIVGFNPTNFNVVLVANNGTGGFSNPLGNARFTLALSVDGKSLLLKLNTAPVANNRLITIAEDKATNIVVTGTDADGDPLTYILVTPPAHGQLTGALPNVTYKPNTNYNGSDAFTFKVSAGGADSAEATVSLTITPVNDAPSVRSFTVERFPGANTVSISFANLLSHANDPENDPVSVTGFDGSSTNGGSITQIGSDLIYAPTSNVNDQFRYRVGDNQGATTTNVVSIIVVDTGLTNSLRLVLENGGVGIGFKAVAGQAYLIQYTTDIANPLWTTLGSAVEGPAGSYQWHESTPPEKTRFYRMISP